jgi:hypothetical protein
MSFRRTLVLSSCLVLCAGCGLRGDLYLPGEEPERRIPEVMPPADPAEPEEPPAEGPTPIESIDEEPAEEAPPP